MALYPKPHSKEWFTALEAFNPRQAAMTRIAISKAGRDDVCSICGDDPATDYKFVDATIPKNAVATLRLCDDCRQIRLRDGEKFAPL